MKLILTISCMSFLNIAIAQNFEESGIDTIRNIEWTTEVISTDFDGIVNNWERFEFNLDLSDRIVVFNCGEDEPFEVLTNTVPESCVYWKLADSTVAILSPKIDSTESISYLNSIDSILMVDQIKLNEYYIQNSEVLSIDTIWVSGNIDISDSDDIAYYLLNKTLYYEGKNIIMSLDIIK